MGDRLESTLAKGFGEEFVRGVIFFFNSIPVSSRPGDIYGEDGKHTAVHEMSDLFGCHAGAFGSSETELLLLAPVVDEVQVLGIAVCNCQGWMDSIL